MKKYLKRAWFLISIPVSAAVVAFFLIIYEILRGAWDDERVDFWR